MRILGWTPLHRAAFRGDVDAVRALLDAGAEADAQAVDGWTPMMSACLEGHARVARLLLERGAKHEVASNDWRLNTLACASGDLDTARVMSPERVSVNDAGLFFLAAHARNGRRMKKLADAGSSDGDMVGYSSSWNERWAVSGRSVLLDDEHMTYLADTVAPLDGDEGVRVGAIDVVADDHSELPHAPPGLCSRYHQYVYAAELASHFLGDAPLPRSRLHEHMTTAVYKAHRDVVDALLREVGKTASALFAAIHVDDAELVAALIDDPNVVQPIRAHPVFTALGVAVRYTKPRAVSVLLEKGANVERSGDNNTPLLHAVEKTGALALDVVIALLEHRANIEATHGEKGWTPLMRAAFMGDAKIVERLLRAEANANAVDKFGMTPLKHAKVGASVKQAEHQDIVELLLGFGAS
jgi:ankyrin repeat protein